MSYKIETNTLHVGHETKKTEGTRAVPIYQSTSYEFKNSDHAAKLFSLADLIHLILSFNCGLISLGADLRSFLSVSCAI